MASFHTPKQYNDHCSALVCVTLHYYCLLYYCITVYQSYKLQHLMLHTNTLPHTLKDGGKMVSKKQFKQYM